MEELVSIIVPVYNVKPYLKTCIDSLLNQTYRNLEVILVDDGSRDGSGKLCDHYLEQDGRILVIHKANEGVGVARNIGIQRATGKYLQFVDSDDVIDVAMTETLMREVDGGRVLPLCNIKMVFENQRSNYELITLEKPLNLSIQQYLSSVVVDYKTNPVIGSPCNKIYMKEIIINNGLEFQKDRTFAEDFIFNLEYLYYVSNVTVMNQALYYYRAETLNSLSKTIKSTEYWWTNYKQLYAIYLELFKHYGLSEDYKTNIAAFMELAVRDCIRKCFSGNSDVSFQDKVQALKYVSEDPLTQELMPSFEGNSLDMKFIKFFSKRQSYQSYQSLGFILVLYSMLFKLKNRLKQTIHKLLDFENKDYKQ